MRNFLTGLLLLIPVFAWAESTHGKRYVGVNVGFYEQAFEAAPSDASLSSLEARVGGYLNDFAALELRAGAGIVGDTVSGNDVDLDYLFGGYTRIGAPFESLFPYVVLGFSRVQLGMSNPDISESETGATYGVGIDMNVANLSVNLEYMQLVDKNSLDLSGFSIGFTSTF